MGKGSKRQRKTPRSNNPKPHARDEVFREEDIDDEIDAFHKQRDVIPLDVDGEAGDSDDDMEQPVFDFEGGEGDDSDSGSGSDDDDENDDDTSDGGMSNDIQPKGFAAKAARQDKYLKLKFGGGDDEMSNDIEQEEEKNALWGRRKSMYYGAENVDYELQSSDEDLPMEEEAEALRLHREKLKVLSEEDFGQDVDKVEDNLHGQKKAFQDGFAGKQAVAKLNVDDVLQDNNIESYEEITKDLSALSKEEQMDVVYSSAPELVGLLAELNEALDQLKRVKPLLSKVVREKEDTSKGGRHYLEVKHILLLAYCQAISFYLLLKSEGYAVRDHPVIARLVEIKNLMEKMKQIDTMHPSQTQETGNQNSNARNNLVRETRQLELQADTINTSVKPHELNEIEKSVKDVPQKDFCKSDSNKQQDVQVGFQSLEMLKVRAKLEAKLKQKGLYNFTNPKPERSQKHLLGPVNRHLETLDDFDDEVKQTAKGDNGCTSLLHLSTLPQLAASKTNKPKFVSGDDDLPKRDDIGERRRKHELRVLARAGANPEGDDDDDNPEHEDGLGTRSRDVNSQDEDGETLVSEDELYQQVKRQRVGKLMVKAQLYSRTPAAPSMETTEADGKRQISYQMEKNRGLTRPRKKLTKIPRKKYKLKHQKAVMRRKGQVRDIRKPTGPYGGEASGVNINVSRSVRFKN